MTVQDVLVPAAIALLGLVLSAMFSGLETGLYTINRVRLVVLAERGSAAARRVQAILANGPRMLATILIGNNIANYLGSFGIAAILDAAGLAPGRAILVNAMVLIPVLFVFGEILPKDLFRTHTDRWTYRCSGFLAAVTALLTWTGLVPLVQGFGIAAGRLLGGPPAPAPTSRQRMSRLIKEGLGAGVLSPVQTTLADRALALRGRRVRDEMVPWSSVATIRADAPVDHPATLVGRREFTRYPVVDARGNVVGVLAILDLLLDRGRPIREFMVPPLLLPAATPLRTALRRMRTERVAIAVVVDARDTPVGLVTLKDLVEPLTGELAVW